MGQRPDDDLGYKVISWQGHSLYKALEGRRNPEAVRSTQGPTSAPPQMGCTLIASYHQHPQTRVSCCFAP